MVIGVARDTTLAVFTGRTAVRWHRALTITATTKNDIGIGVDAGIAAIGRPRRTGVDAFPAMAALL